MAPIWSIINFTQMVSAGGEALTDEAKETTEDNDWTLISNFPLHLYPSSARNNLPKLQCEHSSILISIYPPLRRVSTALPPGLSLSAIYSDFLKYLIDQTHRNFSDRIVDGSRIAGQHWKDMTIAFKLHFSWSIKEQDFIREAFLRIDPHFSGEFRFVEHGEALVCERMFYDVDSPLLKSPVSLSILLCLGSINASEGSECDCVRHSRLMDRYSCISTGGPGV